MVRIGQTIRVKRAQKKLSQRGLAELIGYTGQGIWKIESGRSDPKLSTLSKIAGALDMPLWELVSGLSLEADLSDVCGECSCARYTRPSHAMKEQLKAIEHQYRSVI